MDECRRPGPRTVRSGGAAPQPPNGGCRAGRGAGDAGGMHGLDGLSSARDIAHVKRALIVEDLPAAIRATASGAGLGSFKAVVYDRPAGLLDLVLGRQVRLPQPGPDLRDLSSVLTPRLWYLAPVAEGGILTVGH